MATSQRILLVALMSATWSSAHFDASASGDQASKEIRPGENLVVEGIPPIPASLAAKVRPYTEFRAASLADWHPQRRQMLISTRFANTPQIHLVKMPGGARTQLTFQDEPITAATFDPREGRYFLFAKDIGGNEFTQIYRFDLDSGRITLLTDGGRSQNGGIEWNHRGDRIAYGSTRRNGADRDIYVMDPADPRSDRLVFRGNGGGWKVLDWSPDDRQLLLQEFVSINDNRLWLLEMESGQKRMLAPAAGEKIACPQAQFSRDGKAIYLTSDKDSEVLRLAVLTPADGQVRPLSGSIAWDVESFDLSYDGKTIAFVVNESGTSRLHLLDTATGQTRPVPGVPIGIISGLRWHRNNQDLGLTVMFARSPGDAYSVDVATGELTRWTESELGGLVADELSQPRLIRWKSFDGRQISGFLYEPPARFSGKRPVIVSIHGGPEAQSRGRFLARDNFYLNDLGVAIVLPNVRGSTGFGKSFNKLDDGLRREDAVKDIGALLDWIAAQPGLDGQRVMITGGSYGGYMTLATAIHYSDRIRCAADIVGISNFASFLKNTESYRRDLRRAEYGDERDPAIHEFFERIAPVNNAQRITKPLLVAQGGNDPRVPASESEQMVRKVRQNGVPVWYLLAKDEGHGFRKKTNADFLFYATVLFVQQYLLGSDTRGRSVGAQCIPCGR